MAASGEAEPVDPSLGHAAAYADCGPVLPGFELSIRDAQQNDVGQRRCGDIYLRGPSVMSGYFQDPDSTAGVLDKGFVIQVTGSFWPFEAKPLLQVFGESRNS